jgi:hypothetical protein
MKLLRIQSALAILAFSLVQQGCLFKKEPRKATIIVPPTPQPPPPKPMPAPPSLPNASGPTLQTDGQVPDLPAPTGQPSKKPQRPARRPAGASTANTQQAPVEQQQGESLETPNTPSPVVPSLTPILGQRETSERNKRIAAYLEKARLNVYRAERRRPDGAAQELLTQVKTFVQQAEEARKTDLVRAENLAERAEVLSRGLNP